MPIKTIRHNFRVEVLPCPPGDFGACFVSGITESEDETERKCEQIADDIRRHVDGLPSGRRHGVSVEWDIAKVCEHCGSDWTEDSTVYNGGCCSRDDENAPPDDQQAAE